MFSMGNTAKRGERGFYLGDRTKIVSENASTNNYGTLKESYESDQQCPSQCGPR